LKKRRNADLFVTQADGKQIYGLWNDIAKKFTHQAMYVVTRGKDFPAVLKESSVLIYKVEPATARKSTTKNQAESTADAIARL